MGGIESKFNALLEQGKQTEAVEMWDANVELLHQYNPNAAIRWNDHGDTPLHCAARHEMQSVVMRLMERGGSPFVKNSDEQTALHLVCTSARHSSRTSKRRAALLEVLLAKVDPVKEKGSYLDVKDRVSKAFKFFFFFFLFFCFCLEQGDIPYVTVLKP